MNKNTPRYLYCLAIAFITFVVYANALGGDYMIDDRVLFRASVLDVRSLLAHFVLPDSDRGTNLPGPEESYYRPIAHIWLDIVHGVVGGSPFGHHVVNLLCWIVVGVLLFCFLDFFLADRLWAFWAAVFYLIHPVNGVVINYISGGVFAMQVLCMIASLCLAWGFFFEGRKFLLFLSLSLFVAAMMFHESAVALPIYWFGLLIFVRREKLRRAIILCLPYLGVILVYGVFRMLFTDVGHALTSKVSTNLAIGDYLGALTRLALWYTGKLIYPSGIVLIWATPLAKSSLGIGLLFWGGVLFLGGWGLKKLNAYPSAALGLWWFLVGLLPFAAACLFQSSGVMVEPHWFVFSSAGFFMLVAFALMKIRRQWVSVIVMAGLVIFWGMSSRWYNALWSNEKKYCQYWVEHAPGLKTADFFLARAYVNAKDVELAYQSYVRSLSGRSSDALIYANLGVLDLGSGRQEKAKANFEKALQINPSMIQAFNGMGVLSAQQEDFKTAQYYFEHAASLDPQEIPARINLLKLFLRQDNQVEARKIADQIEIIKGKFRKKGTL